MQGNHGGTLSLLKRLAGDHARTYAPRYAVALVLMVFVAGCTSLSAWFMKYVIDDIFVKNDHAALVWIPAAIATIFILKGFAAYFQEVWLSRIGNRLVADIQWRTYDHVLKMDVSFFQKYSSSDLITRLTQQASAARAFLKNAPVILLDEPTSSLDSETEQIIQSALAELTRGRTTIVIAHRLATVANADVIHILDKGRLVETGTHRDLIQRGGLYAKLYRIQFAESIADKTAAVG